MSHAVHDISKHVADSFLHLHQSRLIEDVMFSPCRLSVRSSGIKLMNTIFWKWVNDFDANWTSGPRTKALNDQLWGQEVNSQGHRRPKLYSRPGGGIIFDPLGRVSFYASAGYVAPKAFFALSVQLCVADFVRHVPCQIYLFHFARISNGCQWNLWKQSLPRTD